MVCQDRSITNLSKIFYFISTDGKSWTMQGDAYGTTNHVNSPCVLKTSSSNYIMYYTEFIGANSRICSVTSIDGLNWTDPQVEISDSNVSNPCVIVDRYKGNYEHKMFYNRVVSSVNVLMNAYLEDRMWTMYDISADTYPCSIQGHDRVFTLNIGVPSATNLKVRLDMKPNITIKDYYVQSEWVYGSDENLSVEVNPDPGFNYNEIIKSTHYKGE